MSEPPGVSRRQALVLGGLAVTAPLVPAIKGAPSLVRTPGTAGAPPPGQLHVQFGADAAAEIAVSWAAADAVARPRLRVGRAHDSRAAHYEFGIDVPAEERVYTEALTGERVYTYHARLRGLAPDTAYVYEVAHDGAQPVPGTFRTGPRGRAKGFRFTSFGDQAIPAAVGQGLGPHTPNAGYIVDAVDALDPLFHLMNGDLCYANVSDAPVATWDSFSTNNMRSARYRPWMPAAGNHENEVGNGPQGYLSYQTRFELPDNGSPGMRGNWYAFTVGPVRVLSINNDDVCLQDGAFSAYRRDHVPGYQANGDDPYIRGYSRGLQRSWLEAQLAAARREESIDWIVVCMHQVAMSSAHFNGADLGIRQEFMPLFDAYGVDLVVAGHEHHFERSFPVRGVLPGSRLSRAARLRWRLMRSADQQPRAERERPERDDAEHRHPDDARNAAKAREVVRVSGADAAPPRALKLSHRPHRAEQQEPRRAVRERRLDKRGCEPADGQDGEDSHRRRREAVAVTHRQGQPGEQDQADQQHGNGVTARKQGRGTEAEQRRCRVTGGRREHHARACRLARRERFARGTRVQPDPGEPPSRGERRQSVTTFVGDGHHVAGHPPSLARQHGGHRDQTSGRYQPARRQVLGCGHPVPHLIQSRDVHLVTLVPGAR